MNGLKTLDNARIILVLDGSELGGAERQGLELARFLRSRRGAVVKVFGLRADSPGRVAELCTEYGLPWAPLPFLWTGNAFSDVLSLLRIAAVFRREKADILLPYTTMPNIVCGLTWRLTGAKQCVWNQRDEGRFLDTGFWHRAAVRQTRVFLSNASVGKDFLVRTYGLPADQVTVVPNAVVLPAPVAPVAEWRKRLGLGAGDLAVVMIANLHDHKDHATLLRAWSIVLEQWSGAGRPPRLFLAGRRENTADLLARLAAELELGDQVVFLGPVQDVSGLLAVVDLCVHSSRAEGLPNAVLEAMAAGCPVVATDIPGIREAVGTVGQNSLVPQGSPEQLAAKIMATLADEEGRRTMGGLFKQRVADEFCAPRIFEKTLQAWKCCE